MQIFLGKSFSKLAGIPRQATVEDGEREEKRSSFDVSGDVHVKQICLRRL